MSDKAQRIYDTMHTAGWPDIVEILDEMIEAPRVQLFDLMAHKPDSLTGKTAISKASRSRGLSDFKEELFAIVAPLNPQGQGQ